MYQLLTQKKNVVHAVPVACRNLKNSKVSGAWCRMTYRNIQVNTVRQEIFGGKYFRIFR